MYKYARMRVGFVCYRDLTLTPRFENLALTEVAVGKTEHISNFINGIKFTTNVSQDFAEVCSMRRAQAIHMLSACLVASQPHASISEICTACGSTRNIGHCNGSV